MPMLDGVIRGIKIYSYALSPWEIYKVYLSTKVNYLPWYRRLLFWLKKTWRLFLNKS